MSLKVCAVTALLLAVLCINQSQEKPAAVLNRCICRGGTLHINVNNIKALQIIPIPNCPLQLVATLKSGRRLCLNSKFKYLWKRRLNKITKV
ncbi:stromal cell-derived factor 1-like [Callorhinchus milii]|uniref:CXCL12 n=1 Tax=Callorhinchus milii TaxID=7868 RepID=V9KMB5_CALMI|nr:stromal cell-derived factor 1-like [Callorhinchus milii]